MLCLAMLNIRVKRVNNSTWHVGLSVVSSVVITACITSSENPFFEHTSKNKSPSQVRVIFALVLDSGMKWIEKRLMATNAWNIKKKVLGRLNLSANPPNSGFAIKPDIGNTVNIVPTKVPEKPNCFAIVGKNGNIGPVAEMKEISH